MRVTGLIVVASVVAAPASSLFTQASPQSSLAGPTFEVVSIKRSTAVVGPGFNSGIVQRPDGGFTGTNIPAGILVSRAYPPGVRMQMIRSHAG
jgi:hypothetical protein